MTETAVKKRRPFCISCRELAGQMPDRMPDELIPARHLIYSSPATLSYNSPGAFGFGVKRAALVIPESVMLLISPGCCGRNSAILGTREEYADRMYYLNMDETDLVSGRHLSVITEAVREILENCSPAPKAVILCITCVDALLGTDLERVCRKAEEALGVHVVPSTMYALTREGIKPPMTAIRQTIYSLLKRKKVNPRAVNLLGYFSPVDPESELFTVLGRLGLTAVRQVSAMKTLAAYEEMGEANFNLVLHPESRFAAEDLQKRLGMPYLEMTRVYDAARIGRQYGMLAAALGEKIDVLDLQEEADRKVQAFREKAAGKTCVIGQMLNANPFELACSLTALSLKVKAVIAIPTAEDTPYIRMLAKVSPDTEVYTGISPTMLNYREDLKANLTIGNDIGGYFPEAAHLDFNDEVQPFGFRGLTELLRQAGEVLS